MVTPVSATRAYPMSSGDPGTSAVRTPAPQTKHGENEAVVMLSSERAASEPFRPGATKVAADPAKETKVAPETVTAARAGRVVSPV